MRIQSTMMHLSMPGVARTDDIDDPMRCYIPDAIPPPRSLRPDPRPGAAAAIRGVTAIFRGGRVVFVVPTGASTAAAAGTDSISGAPNQI